MSFSFFAKAEFSLSYKDQTQNKNPKLYQFITNVTSKLPLKIKESIKRPILVDFEALDGKPQITPQCPSLDNNIKNIKPQLRGKTLFPFFFSKNPYEIKLHIGFKNEILQGETLSTAYPCGHKNLYRLAMATLIHEIGYIYDHLALMSKKEKQYVDECQSFAEPPTNSNYADCSQTQRYSRTISSRKSFQEAAMWKSNALGIPKTKNNDLARSPDPSEISNIEEFFAVNLEYFTLDPEYACRRPALNKYFEMHFKQQMFHNSCSHFTRVILDSQNQQTSERIVADIDPRRIYQIHYLQAASGEALMSRFGHSMFRLIVCAPTRKEVGPDCLYDTDYHVVVSFRANVNDLVTSYMKGLFGGYNSQIFLYSLGDIIKEYADGELRDLYSLPLQISEDQKEIFIYRVLEEYWTYAGKYYFITNNCATEAQDLLKSALAEPYETENPIENSHNFTPIGFYDSLNNIKLTDASLLNNRQAAEQKGYLFLSKQGRYKNAYNNIVANGLPILDWKKFVTELSPAQRKNQYLQIKEKIMRNYKDNNGARIRALAANLGILEKYAALKINANIQKKIISTLEDIRTGKSLSQDEDSKTLLEVANNFFQDQHDISTYLSKDGYGIPLLSEVLQKSSPVPFFDYKKYIKDHFKYLYTELNESQENFIFYTEEASLTY